jgi:two-component system response regulator DctR
MSPTLPNDACIFIVDDDASVRDALGWLLRSRRLLSEPYASADQFWDAACTWQDRATPSCLLLDVRMPGLNGLALFERLLDCAWFEAMPVIFLSGHADVSTAVEAVKRGAYDFCEKPFSDNALVDRVEQALHHSARVIARRHERAERRRRVDGLTDREKDVMHRIAAGMPNKLVADELNISVRTVEVHRAHVFDKMNVRSAVELVHLLRDL